MRRGRRSAPNLDLARSQHETLDRKASWHFSSLAKRRGNGTCGGGEEREEGTCQRPRRRAREQAGSGRRQRRAKQHATSTQAAAGSAAGQRSTQRAGKRQQAAPRGRAAARAGSGARGVGQRARPRAPRAQIPSAGCAPHAHTIQRYLRAAAAGDGRARGARGPVHIACGAPRRAQAERRRGDCSRLRPPRVPGASECVRWNEGPSPFHTHKLAEHPAHP